MKCCQNYIGTESNSVFETSTLQLLPPTKFELEIYIQIKNQLIICRVTQPKKIYIILSIVFRRLLKFIKFKSLIISLLTKQKKKYATNSY